MQTYQNNDNKDNKPILPIQVTFTLTFIPANIISINNNDNNDNNNNNNNIILRVTAQ